MVSKHSFTIVIIFICNSQFLSAIFVTSQRGNSLIRYKGFTYYHKKSRYGPSVKKRWVCSTHFCRGCKAVIYTIDDIIVSVKSDHNHGNGTYSLFVSDKLTTKLNWFNLNSKQVFCSVIVHGCTSIHKQNNCSYSTYVSTISHRSLVTFHFKNTTRWEKKLHHSDNSCFFCFHPQLMFSLRKSVTHVYVYSIFMPVYVFSYTNMQFKKWYFFRLT